MPLPHDAATLAPHPGPESSPTSRTGVGLVSPEPLLLTVPTSASSGAAARAETELSLPKTAVPTLGAGLLGHQVREADELSFAVFPEAVEVSDDGDAELRWAATGVAVDLIFDDGSRLSELGVTDQYGAALTALGQAEARRTWVDQWNLRTVSLHPATGRTVVDVRILARPHACVALRCWFDHLTLTSGAEIPNNLLEAVDTRRGTHSSGDFSRGNNAPLVCVPHGGLFGLPMTDASAGNWPYSYHRHSGVDSVLGRVRPRLQGFGTSHIPSPWMGDRGVFILAPHTRCDPPAEQTAEDRRQRALWFDHSAEVARPDVYQVELSGDDQDGSRTGITAVMTAAHHALGFRFDFERPGSIVLDHRGTVRQAEWKLTDDLLELTAVLHDRADTPEQHIALRIHGVSGVHLHSDAEHSGLSGYVTVRAGAVRAVVALSELTVEAAQLHLSTLGGVEQIQQQAEDQWREIFQRVSIDDSHLGHNAPARRDRLTTLASALYRVHAYPNRAGEKLPGAELAHRNPAGNALTSPIAPEHAAETCPGELSVTNGFWDTYRTQWPLLSLLDAGRTAELAEGLLSHFRDYGWMPRWTAPGPNDMMTGTSSDILFADLIARRIPGVDLTEAYRSAVRNACAAPADARVGRKGLRPGIFRGYVDTSTDEGLSWTLDNAVNDAGIALMAQQLLDNRASLLGHDLAAEAEYFGRRALAYRMVFHPGHRFFLGRTPGGQWRDEDLFDPDVWGYDYTETNAWGTRVTAPHDPTGLAYLFGGDDALGRALDELIARPERAQEKTGGSYGFVIHEQKEARDCRQGMLALSNQPAHHIPLMYTAAGRHDAAHRTVRDALGRLFVGSDLGQGHPGDEDNGEMSAWWLFAATGFYPLVPASGEYVLTPPIWREFNYEFADAAQLRVTTSGSLPLGEVAYIQAVEIDGEPWERITVPHERIAGGAHLHYVLSDEPTGWAAHSRPAGLSERLAAAGYPCEPLQDATTDTAEPAHRGLIDDVGTECVELAAGETVELLLKVPPADARVSREMTQSSASASPEEREHGSATPTRQGLLYTVTLAQPSDDAAWTLRVINSDAEEKLVDHRQNEHYPWARQTRAFLTQPIDDSPTWRPNHWHCVRFTAQTHLRLEQVELFTA